MSSENTTANTATAAGAGSPPEKKKSLYQRFWEFKNHRDKHISEEDMIKYTGKTRGELNEWSKTAPGVGGNQPAGTLAAGPAHGLAGSAAGEGLGGWGPGANAKLKFPNNKGGEQQGKKQDVGKKEEEVGSGGDS